MDVVASFHSNHPSFDNPTSPSSRGDLKSLWSEILSAEFNASTVASSSPSLATLAESGDDVQPNDSSPRTQYVRTVSTASVATGTAASLPLPATVFECSSAAAPSLPANNSSSLGEGPENGFRPDGVAAERPACISPSSNEAASDVKPVIDNSSWPALPEPTRPTLKLSSKPSICLADEPSILPLQGPPSPSIDGKANRPVTTGQKPMSHNVSNAPFIGSRQQESHSHTSSPNHNTQRGSRYGSQFHNGGPNQHRGGRSQYNNYWGVGEQNRGNQNYGNIYTSFNDRDMPLPPRGVPRCTRRPPPPPPYFSSRYSSPPVPPYGGNYGFPEFRPRFPYYAAPPPDPFSRIPYMPPIAPYPVNIPAPDPGLCAKIVRQIDYYFSFDNLIKDMYLRKQMDVLGWVPIGTLAGFRKIKELTDNIQIIVEALQTSSVVEILDDKVRLRVDWQRWIIPDSYELPEVPAFGKARQG